MKPSSLLSASLLASACVLLSVPSHAVGTRRLTLDKEADFKGGDLKGVAVDSRGAVRAGFDLGALPIAQPNSIWSALPQKDGSVLLGTGNEGKLFKVQAGAVTLVAETKALAVTSLASAWGGTVAVGTLPDGKVLKLERGKLVELATLKGAEHVFRSRSTPKTTRFTRRPAPKASSSASPSRATRRSTSMPRSST